MVRRPLRIPPEWVWCRSRLACLRLAAVRTHAVVARMSASVSQSVIPMILPFCLLTSRYAPLKPATFLYPETTVSRKCRMPSSTFSGTPVVILTRANIRFSRVSTDTRVIRDATAATQMLSRRSARAMHEHCARMTPLAADESSGQRSVTAGIRRAARRRGRPAGQAADFRLHEVRHRPAIGSEHHHLETLVEIALSKL
jgi:hypothetical protein